MKAVGFKHKYHHQEKRKRRSLKKMSVLMLGKVSQEAEDADGLVRVTKEDEGADVG